MPDSALRACVIGWPIDHSLSPFIHNHWLKRYAIEGSYDRRAVRPEEIEDFLANFPSHGLAGCNVTLPHKETAYRMADRTSQHADRLGAANTLWLEGETLVADNTDTFGFLANLDDRLPGWDEAETALVIGAGGASRAVIAGLIDRKFTRIRIANRTLERAKTLVDWFAGQGRAQLSAVPLSDLNARIPGAEVIVNTSSAGLHGSARLAIDWSLAAPSAIATDILYVPLLTPFLKDAAATGLPTVDGLGMLLHQAVPGFRQWFGVEPEVDENLRRRLLDALAGKD